MTDIVERMKNHVYHRGGPTIEGGAWNMMLEAADTIEDLRAENARLREALNPFAAVAELSIGESEHDADLFQPALFHPRLIIADFRKASAAMGESDD